MKKTLVWFVMLSLAAFVASAECLVKDGEAIAFLGDSITEFGNWPAGYVNMVVKGLELQGVRATKIPAGVSGNKCHQMLSRLPGVLAKKPTWLTLSCGVNDVWHGKNGVELEEYKLKIREILDKTQAAGVKPVLLTATLIGEDVGNANNKKAEAYNAFLREEAAARKIPLADLNARMRETLAALPPAKEKGANRLTRDGVHMNYAGNEMMAKGVLAAFGVEADEKVVAAWKDLPEGAATYCILSQAGMEKLQAKELPGEDHLACAHRLAVEGVKGPIVAPPPCSFTPAKKSAPVPPATETFEMAWAGDRVCAYGAGGFCGFATMVEKAYELNGVKVVRRSAEINNQPTRELVAKAKKLAEGKPKRTVLEAGCFEVRKQLGWDKSLAELKGAMAEMMDAFQAAGSDLLVLGLPITNERADQPGPRETERKRVAEYNAWLKEECARRKVKFVDLQAIMLARNAELGEVKGEKFGDGRFVSGFYHVGLSFEGRALVAAEVCKAFGLATDDPKYLAAWKNLPWVYNIDVKMSVNEMAALKRRAAELKMGERDLACRYVQGTPVIASSSVFAAEAGEPGDSYKKVGRLDCTTDKPPVSYKCGETAVVTFATPKNTNDLEIIWTIRRDYDKEETKGKGNVVKVMMDRPGFVWISAKAGKGKWPYSYDASIGFDVDKIRVTTKKPADLEAFWSARKAEVAAIDMKPRVEEVKSPTLAVKLYKVELDAPGMGQLASGWLSVPQNPDVKYPAVAKFFGYGNSWAAFHHVAPTKVPADRIEFLVNAHAYGLERDKAHYDAVYQAAQSNGHSHGMDPVQNAKPETCYFLGMVLRDLTAMRYLKTRPEWDGKNLMVKGHSQGGLQSAWMAALCDGVTVMRAEAPWNCNMAGWTEGRIRPTRLPIADAPGLAYFDPCHLATLFPKDLDATIVRAGLGDYCCPPSGIAAFYNAIPCPKKISWAQGSHHSDLPIDVRWTRLSADGDGK